MLEHSVCDLSSLLFSRQNISGAFNHSSIVRIMSGFHTFAHWAFRKDIFQCPCCTTKPRAGHHAPDVDKPAERRPAWALMRAQVSPDLPLGGILAPLAHIEALANSHCFVFSWDAQSGVTTEGRQRSAGKQNFLYSQTLERQSLHAVRGHAWWEEC